MNRLPHFVYQNLKLAGFDSLGEIVEYMGAKHPRYKLTCIPNIGNISAKHILKRLVELDLIKRTRFDK